MFWRLYPSLVLIAFISLLAVVIVSWFSFSSFYYKQVELELELKAKLFLRAVNPVIQKNNFVMIQDLTKQFGQKTNTRYTVVMLSGKVIGDSMKSPSKMDNHSDRPEIMEALKSGRGISVRFGYTLQTDSMYFAIPIIKSNRYIGVVRSSTPLLKIEQALEDIFYRIIATFLVLIILVSVLGWYISKKISVPLEKIKNRARKMAEGDLSGRVDLKLSDPLELIQLGHSINEIATQLDNRIETILTQRNEQEAIFLSMNEGVIAINSNQTILRMNRASIEILDVDNKEFVGKTVPEIIRNSELEKFILSSLVIDEISSRSIEIQKGNGRFLLVESAPLLDNESKKCGIVLVINDISQLKALENYRKEFVSNVSHELKTPLTIIQGSIETLINSEKIDEKKKIEFLDSKQKHSKRLGMIIDDLLDLARIEKETELKEIQLMEEDIKFSIKSAIDLCKESAERKKVHILLDYDENCIVRHNPSLIEQAIFNLIDNAIKYSKVGDKVEIKISNQTDTLIIEVQDSGIGIPQEHISRIFERFYRVDRARSRTLGGTGLGLSIVKHIVQVHEGKIDVKSNVGKGTTFTICLNL